MIYRTQDDLERARKFFEKMDWIVYPLAVEALAQKFAEIREEATHKALVRQL